MREKSIGRTILSHTILPQTYGFRSLDPEFDNIEANENNLPSVYPAGTQTSAHASVDFLVLESVKKSREGKCRRQVVSMDAISNEKFTLDIGHTHVIEAIG